MKFSRQAQVVVVSMVFVFSVSLCVAQRGERNMDPAARRAWIQARQGQMAGLQGDGLTPQERADLPPRLIQIQHGDPALLAELFGGSAIWGGEMAATGNVRGGNVNARGGRAASEQFGAGNRGINRGGFGRGFGGGGGARAPMGSASGGSYMPFGGFVPARPAGPGGR